MGPDAEKKNISTCLDVEKDWQKGGPKHHSKVLLDNILGIIKPATCSTRWRHAHHGIDLRRNPRSSEGFPRGRHQRCRHNMPRGRPSLLWMWIDCFAPLSYRTVLIRATKRECIPRGDGGACWSAGAMLEKQSMR